MKLSKIIAFVLGIIIIVLLIKFIGLNNLISILKNFNLVYLPIIIIILLLHYILGGLSTWIIAISFKKVPLFYLIKATFITLVYAAITPGKFADLLMIFFLKKQNLNLSQSTIIFGIDKLISLFVRIFFGLLGTIFILKKFDFLFLGVPLIILFISIFIIFILNSKKFLNFIKKNLFGKHSHLFKGFYKNLKGYAKKNKKFLYYNTFITIIKAFLEALLFFFLFLAFGQSTNVIVLFLIFSLLSVIMLITFPIGISGLGPRELLGIIVFGTIGINPAIVFNSFILRMVLIYLINLFTIVIYREELNLLKGSKIFKKIKF